MTQWAIVPYREHALQKSRLAPRVTADTRRALARAMLRDVVDALRRTPRIDTVLVVGDGTSLLPIGSASEQPAAECRVLTTDAPLNRAVTLALRAAEQGGARAALIAHADLPLLNTSAVQAFLALAAPADDARTAAIAPCQRADGTSLLWLPLPAPIAVDYGPGSFLRHVRSLLAVGYSVQVGPRQPDLDLPDDLGALLVSEALDPQSETAKVLAAVVAGREPGLVRGRHAQ